MVVIKIAFQFIPGDPAHDIKYIQKCFPNLKKWTFIIDNSNYAADIEDAVKRYLPNVLPVCINCGLFENYKSAQVERVDAVLLFGVLMTNTPDRRNEVVQKSMEWLKQDGVLVCWFVLENSFRRWLCLRGMVDHPILAPEWDHEKCFWDSGLQIDQSSTYPSTEECVEGLDNSTIIKFTKTLPFIEYFHADDPRIRKVIFGRFPDSRCDLEFGSFHLSRMRFPMRRYAFLLAHLALVFLLGWKDSTSY